MPRSQRLLVLLLSLLAVGCAAGPDLAVDPCASPYVEADPGRTAIVRLPMRDCARLVTSVHFPEGEGPWPVILVRTPYGRGEEGMMPIDGAKLQFVPRGYVVVSQDVRGRFGSDGEFTVLQYEGVDGADTLSWIERQPGSTDGLASEAAVTSASRRWRRRRPGPTSCRPSSFRSPSPTSTVRPTNTG